MTPPQFLVPPGALDQARPGTEHVVVGEEAHHALTVRKLGVGDRIDLVDGRGTRLRGTIAVVCPAGRGTLASLAVAVSEMSREANEAAGLVLVQGLAKAGRDEQAVEAATELGIETIIPWQAARSVVKWPGEKRARGRARWEAIAEAETKVARRAWLARVEPLHSTADLVEAVAAAVGRGAEVLVLHEAASEAFVTRLAALAGAAGQAPAIWLVVGPEGGITEAELTALRQAGAHPVVLGRSVLRSSTAGPVALAVLHAALGRLGG